MKVGILAGGLGSRLAEETVTKPKPMVEIGNQPILWHIMKHYSHYGFNEFVVALGYKGEYIKRWMVDYVSLASDLTVHRAEGTVEYHDNEREDWTVSLVDTGQPTATGGRIESPRIRTWATRRSCSPGATASRTSIWTHCSRSTAPTASWRR